MFSTDLWRTPSLTNFCWQHTVAAAAAVATSCVSGDDAYSRSIVVANCLPERESRNVLTRRRSSCRVGGECCGGAAVGLEAEQSASRRWVAEWTPTSTAALLSGWLPLFLQMCLQLLGVWMHSCCWLARRTVSLGASHGVPSPSRRGPSRPSCPSSA